MSHGVAGARTGAVEAATAEALSARHADAALERTIETIERESRRPVDPASRAELERLFREHGKGAIERLRKAGINAELDPRHDWALEAIVEVDGSRPTLAVSAEDRISLDDPTLGQWLGVAKRFAEPISAVATAVGRIDLDGRHKGTGFVVKEGLILTNRHVLQGLASQRETGTWEFRGEPTISFDANPEKSRDRQFTITRVVLTGPDQIDPVSVDCNKLDFAILECEAPGGKAFPAPLSLESDADKIAEGRPVFAVGYPAHPGYDTYESPVLDKLFRYRYGVKRFSPGEIDRGLGSTVDGTGEAVFAHDATTLGGNSGSCVVDFGNDGQLVVGLHFAGVPRQANYAHANARLHARLADLGLTWREWI
jgi:S1-C subfamily serine protease